MTVNILGTPYEIIVKKYDEEEAFERRSICGFSDEYSKEIVVCDMKTYKGWEHETEKSAIEAQKRTVRHEIVHAFYSESGLGESSYSVDAPWARNEEMVEWFAVQGAKIYKAWQEADAL